MGKKQLRVQAFQGIPVPRDPNANKRLILKKLETSDADLLVFPELFFGGYQTKDLEEIAQPIDCDLILQIADTCKRLRKAIVIGTIEAAPEGYYDVLVAIDNDGTVLPFVRKTHLFGSERDVFEAGDKIEPVELCGVKVGLMNCFEVEFPEIARTLALQGAEILVTSSANMSPYEADHTHAVIARALENRLPHVYSNRVGKESGHNFCGLTRIVLSDGSVIAELDAEESASIVADVVIGSDYLDEVDMLSQRRPELYRFK